ncbi:unnamed protein product [Polarella glacialis]|uniref:Uncharacterized protein n=1 Tax=Polarella glacialis TaxID=89957 RepID=A0A813H2S7_POLGL|nr:unnamed protein product [Polarella glacialis]
MAQRSGAAHLKGRADAEVEWPKMLPWPRSIEGSSHEQWLSELLPPFVQQLFEWHLTLCDWVLSRRQDSCYTCTALQIRAYNKAVAFVSRPWAPAGCAGCDSIASHGCRLHLVGQALCPSWDLPQPGALAATYFGAHPGELGVTDGGVQHGACRNQATRAPLHTPVGVSAANAGVECPKISAANAEVECPKISAANAEVECPKISVANAEVECPKRLPKGRNRLPVAVSRLQLSGSGDPVPPRLRRPFRFRRLLSVGSRTVGSDPRSDSLPAFTRSDGVFGVAMPTLDLGFADIRRIRLSFTGFLEYLRCHSASYWHSEEHHELQRELSRSQRELGEARRAGGALLAAVEAAMAPLMAELATARRSCHEHLPDEPTIGSDEVGRLGSSFSGPEAEIRHLGLDIVHFQSRAERLQLEDQSRCHELARLRKELQEAAEELSYEQQRVRHHEVCRQLGLQDGGWVGLGPLGVGKRTLEARAEKKMRESAEQRSGRLVRDVTKLAGDTAEQQATIEQLSRQLDRVRQLAREKERRLTGSASQTAELHAKLRGTAPAGPAGLKESFGIASLSKLSTGSKKMSSSSTGKLPQLSF